jgi:hypothetical protein
MRKCQICQLELYQKPNEDWVCPKSFSFKDDVMSHYIEYHPDTGFDCRYLIKDEDIYYRVLKGPDKFIVDLIKNDEYWAWKRCIDLPINVNITDPNKLLEKAKTLILFS